METKYSLGIDVHRKSWSAASCLRKEILFRHRQDPSIEVLLKVLQRRGLDASNTRIAYEVGPTGYGLYDELTERGFEVFVVSPAHTPRAPADRVKTDSRDCRDLALKLEAGMLKGISVPTPEERSVRDLVRTRRQLVEKRSALLQMIKSKLLFIGVDYGTHRSWTRRYREYLVGLALPLGHRKAIDHLIEVIDVFTAQIKETEEELCVLFLDSKYAAPCALLESIPGIGSRGAAVILAEIRDIGRFATADRFASYLGLTPMEHSSGETIRRGRITRQGNGHVRTILVEAVWSAVRRDPSSRERYERYQVRMGRKRAVVALARRMSAMIWRMLQTGEFYRSAPA